MSCKDSDLVNHCNSGFNVWYAVNILCLKNDKTQSLEFRLMCDVGDCDNVEFLGVSHSLILSGMNSIESRNDLSMN